MVYNNFVKKIIYVIIMHAKEEVDLMKKRFLKNIFSLLVLIILSLALYEIFRLDILPKKYMIIVCVCELLLYLLGLLFYNFKKKIFVIIGILLYIISIISNIVVFYYFGKTNDFIEEVFVKNTYKVNVTYYLVTSSNNPVNSIDEIGTDNTIYYYQYSELADKATKELGNYNYTSVVEGFNTLTRTKDENLYFLLSNVDYNFMIDASNMIDYSDYKIIKEYVVEEEYEVNDNVPSSYNIYLTGFDYSGSRRDYNLLITVNTKTKKVVLTSIPRDYYIPFKTFGGAKDSLTNVGSMSSEIPKSALEDLFNTKIDYTVDVYTKSLVNVVDQLGGVEFCSNYAFYTKHDLTLGSYNDYGEKLYVRKGCYNYNGLEILAIARERVHLYDGDRGRQDNCRKILISIGKKLSTTINLTNYVDILNSFNGLYTSNINKNVMKNLVREVIDDPNFEIIEQRVDGEDGKGPTRYGTGEVWTLEPYMDQVEAASNVINSVLKEG